MWIKIRPVSLCRNFLIAWLDGREAICKSIRRRATFSELETFSPASISRISIQRRSAFLSAIFPASEPGKRFILRRIACPGAGWVFESSGAVDLTDAAGKPHRVGEYIITNGDARQFVLYWYQAHGRSVASEYMAKVYMVADAMRKNRTDGALVRVITPITANEDTAVARGRAEAFTRQLAPLLPRFIPD